MKIAVALSGGVDSAVALYLLKKEGHDLFGLFMKNWEEEREECAAQQDAEDARRVCDLLQVPLYTVNFAQEYWDNVFHHFLQELKNGFTPNPDILCNREIKFKVLFDKAQALGADFLATGHYCRTEGGKLFKGTDNQKDQSYFLYAVKQEVLRKVLFPVGHLDKKNEVRKMAREGRLPVSNKRDSTGICFIGKRKFSTFLEKYLPPTPGPIESTEGQQLGVHRGIYYYTIGQRKGMGIGGAGEAWFVAKKDQKRNVLIVAQGENHPSLFATALQATTPSWIGEKPSFPLRCTGKIRYRQIDEPCVVEKRGEKLVVTFARPQRAITPRQSVAFYRGDECLGGAFIEKSFS